MGVTKKKKKSLRKSRTVKFHQKGHTFKGGTRTLRHRIHAVLQFKRGIRAGGCKKKGRVPEKDGGGPSPFAPSRGEEGGVRVGRGGNKNQGSTQQKRIYMSRGGKWDKIRTRRIKKK